MYLKMKVEWKVIWIFIEENRKFQINHNRSKQDLKMYFSTSQEMKCTSISKTNSLMLLFLKAAEKADNARRT